MDSVADLVECWPIVPEVVGSNPGDVKFYWFYLKLYVHFTGLAMKLGSCAGCREEIFGIIVSPLLCTQDVLVFG